MTTCLLAGYSRDLKLEEVPTQPNQPFYTNLNTRNELLEEIRLGSFYFQPITPTQGEAFWFQKKVHAACAAAGIAVPTIFTLGTIGKQIYIVSKDLRVNDGVVGIVDDQGKATKAMEVFAMEMCCFHNQSLEHRLEYLALLFSAATYDHRLNIGQTLKSNAFFVFGYSGWASHLHAPVVGIRDFSSLKSMEASLDDVHAFNQSSIHHFMAQILASQQVILPSATCSLNQDAQLLTRVV